MSNQNYDYNPNSLQKPRYKSKYNKSNNAEYSRKHIKPGEDGEAQSIKRINLSGQIEGTTKQEAERKVESPNVLIDRVTKYLNDYDVDLLFMEGENYFKNFKGQFEKFKNSISESQQDLNNLAMRQIQLKTLFNGLDKIKDFNEIITKANYDEEDYQLFIESNQSLKRFPIYNKLLIHFDNFQERITLDEQHLESVLNSHEVNITNLSQKCQDLIEYQNQLDKVFQGAQEIKKFNEALTNARYKDTEIQPFINPKHDLKRFTVYEQFRAHLQHFQECTTQSKEYLASNDPNIVDLPQKHQNLTESQNQLEKSYHELLHSNFQEHQLGQTVGSAQQKSATISKVLASHTDDISWLKESGCLPNFEEHSETFKAGISKAERYLKSNQLNNEDLLKHVQDLTTSQNELDKALKVIDLKVALTNAERKRDTFNQNEFEDQSKLFDMEKYAQICLKNFHEGISEVQQYFKNSQISNEDTSEKLRKLTETQRDLDKALTTLDFRKELLTAEAILDKYRPQVPEKVERDREGRVKVYWKKFIET
jgi:hypothetical protein